MAQSAIAKSPIGVTLYWDNGPQPNIVWEKWFETVKLAITAKEKYTSRKTTQTQTTKRRTRLPTRAPLRTSHIRRNNSREKATRTAQH